MPPRKKKPPALREATVGVLTALPHEFAPAKVVFGCFPDPVHSTGRSGCSYALARIDSRGGGEHVVAVTLLPSMGTHQASVRATLLLQDCPDVRHILMVGIAGAVPNPAKAEDHVRLGDIVVSDRYGVVQYDFVKETETFKEIRSPPLPPGRALTEAVRWLKSEEEAGDLPWEKYLEAGLQRLGALFDRPAQEKDALQDDPALPPVAHPNDLRRTRTAFPRVFHGPIASSNTLLKNPQVRDKLRDGHKVKAVEMEAGGVADATWHDDMAGYLVVRGTCDYCNQGKGDDWQRYAALIAAAFARSVIECMAAQQKGEVADVGKEMAAVKRELRSIRKSIPIETATAVPAKTRKPRETPQAPASPAVAVNPSDILLASRLAKEINLVRGQGDLGKAQDLGEQLDAIVAPDREAGIPADVLRESLYALVDLHFALASQGGEVSSFHTERARAYLERVKHVSRN